MVISFGFCLGHHQTMHYSKFKKKQYNLLSVTTANDLISLKNLIKLVKI